MPSSIAVKRRLSGLTNCAAIKIAATSTARTAIRKAFAATTNVITITGFVNAITD